MPHVVISYFPADRVTVAPLIELLEATGWEIYSHEHGGQIGQAAIANVAPSPCHIVVWSASSSSSSPFISAAQDAYRRGTLLPVVVDGTRPPLALSLIQAVEIGRWLEGQDDEPARQLLTKAAKIMGVLEPNSVIKLPNIKDIIERRLNNNARRGGGWQLKGGHGLVHIGNPNGHGYHWSLFTGDMRHFLSHWLGHTTNIGVTIDKGLCGPPEGQCIGLVWPATPLAGLLLIVLHGKENIAFTGYPYALTATRHRLRIRRIVPRDNEYEGVLVTALERPNEPPLEVAFFDTRFYANRDRYQIGMMADFELAGLILQASVVNLGPKYVESQQAIHVMRQNTATPRDVTPIQVQLRGTTIFSRFGNEGAPADYYELLGPVRSVEQFNFAGANVLRLTTRIRNSHSGGRQEGIDIELYAPDRVWKTAERPQSGSDISGFVWLQGHLAAPDGDDRMDNIRRRIAEASDQAAMERVKRTTAITLNALSTLGSD